MTSRFAAVTVHGTWPHTTPVAAVGHGGAWWFTTSRQAAKVALLRRDAAATITVPSAGGATSYSGRAQIVDGRDLSTLVRDPSTATTALPAALRLLGRYACDVVGYLARLGDITADWSPYGRVLVAVHPEFDEHATSPDVRGRDDLRCLVGLSDGRRPIVAPGWFDGERVLIGATARPIDRTRGIAVMVDGAMLGDDPNRPTEQHGVLIRGRIDDLTDDHAPAPGHRIELTATRITRWRGFDADTRRFDTRAA